MSSMNDHRNLNDEFDFAGAGEGEGEGDGEGEDPEGTIHED